MSELNGSVIASTSIATPNTGLWSGFVDSINKEWKVKDDTGYVHGGHLNFSATSQSIPATTRTYLTGSKLSVPKNKLQIGTILRWCFNMTKTAAGVATSTIDVCFGTAGTVADTARVSFTKPAGTAVADEGWVEIECIVRGPLNGSCIVTGEFRMVHNGNTAGHAVIPCVVVNAISAGFDVTVADLMVGICLTTGSADVITVQQVTAEARNL